jgi:hypothetical protein
MIQLKINTQYDDVMRVEYIEGSCEEMITHFNELAKNNKLIKNELEYWLERVPHDASAGITIHDEKKVVMLVNSSGIKSDTDDTMLHEIGHACNAIARHTAWSPLECEEPYEYMRDSMRSQVRSARKEHAKKTKAKTKKTTKRRKKKLDKN